MKKGTRKDKLSFRSCKPCVVHVDVQCIPLNLRTNHWLYSTIMTAVFALDALLTPLQSYQLQNKPENILPIMIRGN